MQPILTLRNVRKVFYDKSRPPLVALKDIDLEIMEGEFFVFVGPSGCGKSTLLRIIAGLESSYQGTVQFLSKITHSDLGFVFQQFALLPWLTVFENIELGLLAKKMRASERKRLVMAEASVFRIEKFVRQHPKELSGGMRQRVGLARALVGNPKIICMDEPFSELDSFTAELLRKELLHIWDERKPTIIMVTHNITETLQLADRVAVLSSLPGRVEKVITNMLPRPRDVRSQDFYRMEDALRELIQT